MKVNVSYTISDSDYELLRKKSNLNNPCLKCSSHGTPGCCGCPEERDYKERLMPIRSANLSEVYNDYMACVDSLNTALDALTDFQKIFSEKLSAKGFDNMSKLFDGNTLLLLDEQVKFFEKGVNINDK